MVLSLESTAGFSSPLVWNQFTVPICWDLPPVLGFKLGTGGGAWGLFLGQAAIIGYCWSTQVHRLVCLVLCKDKYKEISKESSAPPSGTTAYFMSKNYNHRTYRHLQSRQNLTVSWESCLVTIMLETPKYDQTEIWVASHLQQNMAGQKYGLNSIWR